MIVVLFFKNCLNTDFQYEYAGASITSALFNEQENEDHNKMHEWIDRKRGRKLKEKKIAQGIRG